MSFSALTFSDEVQGRLFRAWVEEFLYAMGADLELDRLVLPRPENIVLALSCLPEQLRGACKVGTSLKRAAGEFWSTAEASYEQFALPDAAAKIESIRLALRDAVQQLPVDRIPEVIRNQIIEAIDAAAKRLLGEPARHPR